LRKIAGFHWGNSVRYTLITAEPRVDAKRCWRRKMESSMKIIAIGLGHQTLDDHLPAMMESDRFELVGVHDIDKKTCHETASKYDCEAILDLEKFLAGMPDAPIDGAVVALPHDQYLPVLQMLAEKGIHIIKEKPYATCIDEALKISSLIKKHKVSLSLTLQRRYNPVFNSFAQLVRRIGRLHTIEAKYVLNIARLDEGWRASQLHAGGGALIDLGYHYVDLLVWYFGLPDEVTCITSSGNREGQEYDVEDTALVQMRYLNENSSHSLLGSLIVSRVFPRKNEGLTAYGTKGHVNVQRGSVTRTNQEGEVEESLVREKAWPSALVDQLEASAEAIVNPSRHGFIDPDYLMHVAFVEACYRAAETHKPQNPKEIFLKLIDDVEGLNDET